ncbi:uncharacterized protein [Macrobrachium rosenbergii]|uniref:uncharacterized protein isoform X2 n=1 Tax=Macrobrachium rosenbergii TaxID=79674 RepID=UPI0034D3F463
MNLSMSTSPTHQDDPYAYSTEHICWVLRNTTHLNETENTSTYCYYGLGVIIPIATILVTAMVLAIVGNFMVIVTIARHRGMRTRTNLLLANLAVADILVAVLDMPISLITVIKGDWIFSHNFCDFNGFAVGLGFMLSIHTLMWISIHKYISITRPFSRSVTPGKITMMILAAWAWAIFYNLTPTSLIGLTDTEYKLGASQCGPAIPRALSQYIHSAINTTVNLALPITIMTFCYYRIFKEVKDHLKRMRHFADESACNSLIEQKQITETLCIVLSVFVLFWLPYIVYSMSLALLGKKYVPVIANPIAYMFGYMNSACNPIIYALRSPSFRRGFKEIICGAEQRGFSGSVYGRQDSRNSNMGRIVLSFRRSLFNKGVVGREKMQNLSFHGIQRQPKPAAGKFSPVSRVGSNRTDGTPERRNPPKIDQMHQQLYKEDTKTNPVAYKNMNTAFKVQISQNVNKKAEFCDSCSSEVKPNRSVSALSSVNRTAEEGDVDEVAQTDTQVTEKDNSADVNNFSGHPQIDNEESGTPCNITPHTLLLSHDYKISASQPDVTMHPSPNLNIWVGGSRISSSNRDILVTTLEIEDNQIRSVSVGDVRVMCPPPTPPELSPTPAELSPASCPEVQNTCLDEDLPHQPSQKFKRKFVWQPSVDTLYGSPVISKRKFHTRKMGVSGGMDTTDNSDRYEPVPREKKSSTGSQGPSKKTSTGSLGTGKNLLVTNLITSFKKSLTDLFHNSEDDSQMLQPEAPSVICAGVRTLSESGGVYHSCLPTDDNMDAAEKNLTDIIVKQRSRSCEGTADVCLDASDGYM